MDSIKKFFEKKKKDAKFKMAGEGKKLTATCSSMKDTNLYYNVPNQRFAPSAEAQRAGAAALARFESTTTKEVNWSLQAIKAQARREMEAEKKMADMKLESEGSAHTLESVPQERHFEGAPMLATAGVYFYCPLLGPDVDTYEETKKHIREFLFSQLGDDQGVASCLIIHTCNKNKEKVGVCVETLCKYIENILSNPSETKYRKIRQSNRAFQDRIAPIEGTKEFLEAAGFEEQELPFNDTSEKFWVFPEEKMDDLSLLESLRDAVVSAEPLKPQLDRNLRVLLPKEAAEHTDLPPEFFALSIEELKKEQQLRIRFPDGIILQGTFALNEKFRAVSDFVRENLVNDWRPFFLSVSGGGKVTEEEESLLELHLVPAVVCNFEWDSSVQDPNLDDRVYLKEEILMLLQSGD